MQEGSQQQRCECTYVFSCTGMYRLAGVSSCTTQVVRLEGGKGKGGAGGWFPSPSHMSKMVGRALRDLWMGLSAGFLKAHTLCCQFMRNQDWLPASLLFAAGSCVFTCI